MILIPVVLFFMFLAGLFAGAETGIYQLSRLRLRLGIEQKQFSFVILAKALRDSGGLLISILIGTNLSYYIITSIVTYMLLRRVSSVHTAEFLATLITAPMLFVFSDLLPKSIFFYRADLLMPYVAPFLFSFKKLLTWCPIVPLLKFISGLFGRLTGLPDSSRTAIASTQRHQIRALLRDTHEEGFLSPTQTAIINRLASMSNISIRSVMTPINKVQMVEVNSDTSALMSKLKECAFTRLLVYEGRVSNIVGFINIYEALSSVEESADLHNFIKPIRELGANTAVIDAINIMQEENEKTVLVTRIGHAGRERPVGIVTMKDLVEELVGDLTEW